MTPLEPLIPSRRITDLWSEAEWQDQVLRYADTYAWWSYHAPDNRPNEKGHRQRVTRGWPDLVLLKGSRLLAAELKKEKDSRVSPEQHACLHRLALIPGVETYIWRPSDAREVLRVLSGRPRDTETEET